MNIEEFEKIFKEELSNNNVNLELNTYESFYKYMKEIIDWNEKINVTAITDEKEFLVKHLIDSLTIEQFIDGSKRLIDIGTGAGFPGVPIRIAKPNLKVTLLDSVNKKLNVVRVSTEAIGINDIEIIHSRAEDLAAQKGYREEFDYATTRAVSRLNVIAEYMLPFVKIGGKAICMKGPNISEELEEAKKAIEVLGGKIEKVEKIFIDKEYERNIVIISKVKNTPKQFPRGKGKPLKEPIM